MASISLSPLGSDEKSEVEVTLEDQQSINRFARLNTKADELNEHLKDLKRQIENIEEADNELTLADDDEDDDLGGDENLNSDVKNSKTKSIGNIHFSVGDAFVTVNKAEAETLLEERKKELQLAIEKNHEKLNPMKEEMNNIKAKLYAKFGSTINLDTEE